ncbi:hypothetical protein FRC00_009169 [Tulasnella sp. 408]|nr:hypothetical protein FRC00_009169 [Tulasnella sp. 408]
MITLAQYPLDIPTGTGVPAWAYQDVSLHDRWNETLALPQISVAPESTYYGTPTATLSYRSSTAGDVATQTGATSATVSQTSAASTESSKSNTGPIVGGAVGGTIALLIIGVLAWLLIRRRRNEALVPSLLAVYLPGGGQMGEANNYPVAVDYGTSYPASSPTLFSGSKRTSKTLKLYDPEDPSTFPKTPSSFGYQPPTLTNTATPPHKGSTSISRYTSFAEI